MPETPQTSAPAGMRGWLSELLFPTVVEGPGAIAPLAKRLGGRATLALPLFDRASGMPDVETALAKLAGWLVERRATYALHKVIVGTDRDVSEGTLAVTPEGSGTLVVPVAVVTERRRSREVELRVYHACKPLGVDRPARGSLLRDNKDSAEGAPAAKPSPGEAQVPLPILVDSHLAALRKGDVNATLACFETDAVLVDSKGARHGKADGGIASHYAASVGLGGSGEDPAGVGIVSHGYADDGRACAVELTVVRLRGAEVPPRAMLAVYQRGDSGLFKELRLYEDGD